MGSVLTADQKELDCHLHPLRVLFQLRLDLGENDMKKVWIAAAALAALPTTGHAQLQYPGFYISAEGGLNWMFNTTINVPNFGGLVNVYPNTGWVVGGSIGYDFVGPRFEIEGVY